MDRNAATALASRAQAASDADPVDGFFAPQGAIHVLTGEYPPASGGVSDYTRIVARELTARGCEVHVWQPAGAPGSLRDDAGVQVHSLDGSFGPRQLRALGRRLNASEAPRRVLVQYVPHAYGFKAMNVFLPAWLLWRAKVRRDDVRVMFHEVAFPWVKSPRRHNIIAAMNRVMAWLLCKAATHAYLSIPAWDNMLRRLGGRRLSMSWAPIPSTLGEAPSRNASAAVRRRHGIPVDAPLVGHFGSYGQSIARQLSYAIPRILDENANAHILLIGRSGDRWLRESLDAHPEWTGRVSATGEMSAELAAAAISASNVMLQTYPDGASSRRTSLMVCLATGKATVTTEGPLSEPLWRESGAVALAPAGDLASAVEHVASLLRSPSRRRELGDAAEALYQSRFSIEATMQALLNGAASQQQAASGVRA